MQHQLIGLGSFGDDATCPDGMYGTQPNCYTPPANVPAAVPAAVPASVPVATPSATTPTQITQSPPAQDQQVAALSPPSWWSQRSDTEKWMVVGAATLGVVGLVTLLRSAVSPSYAANKRRRHSRRASRRQ